MFLLRKEWKINYFLFSVFALYVLQCLYFYFYCLIFLKVILSYFLPEQLFRLQFNYSFFSNFNFARKDILIFCYFIFTHTASLFSDLSWLYLPRIFLSISSYLIRYYYLFFFISVILSRPAFYFLFHLFFSNFCVMKFQKLSKARFLFFLMPDKHMKSKNVSE